jgi:uncharacterized protein (DUF983 family)
MKLNTVKSIITCTCPKCKQGKLFVDPNPYHFSNIAKMVDVCPNCGFSLSSETGFYWFSMYVSYILSISISAINYIWFGFIFGWLNILPYVMVNAIILLIIWPFVFRWARMISINLTLKLNI